MFEYIFAMTFKEYVETFVDWRNAGVVVIGLPVATLLFGWLGILAWILVIKLSAINGGSLA